MVVWGGRRTIPVLLASATLLPILALGWLGFRVLEQDRALERQRERERLEFAAGRLALGIERRLVEIEAALARGAGLRFAAAGIEGGAVLYQPVAPAPDESVSPVIIASEALEYAGQDLKGAAAAYRRAGESSHPGLQAAALVRLGRVLRKLALPGF